MPLKNSFKGLTYRLAACILHGTQLQHVAAELIAYRQGFAPAGLSPSPPALEVHRPHFVGSLTSAPTAQSSSFPRPLSHSARLSQAHLLQYPLKTALAWRLPMSPMV